MGMLIAIIAALSEIGFFPARISERLDKPHPVEAIMDLNSVFHDTGNGELNALEVVHRICGEAAALRLLDAFGGERVYFPVRPSADHPIAQVIGHKNALLIGKEIGRTTLCVQRPAGAGRWNIILWASLAELSKRTMVRLTGYRQGHVFYVVAKLRDAGHLPARGQS